jgi:hypothetical protein
MLPLFEPRGWGPVQRQRQVQIQGVRQRGQRAGCSKYSHLWGFAGKDRQEEGASWGGRTQEGIYAHSEELRHIYPSLSMSSLGVRMGRSRVGEERVTRILDESIRFIFNVDIQYSTFNLNEKATSPNVT